LEQAIGLELRQDAFADEVLRQRRRLGPGMHAEEVAHQGVKAPAVDEVAAAQVPDKPLAGPKFGRGHRYNILCSREGGARTADARPHPAGWR